ncbi:hypothetical protein [Nocardia terpenica]|uniref:Uncharacterized protein n=1 Tax=Nocardia terpenica TaxID=455432 RepID=A0A6G9YYT3_9NOCA|nr:hypothetical protein [Nocardia terpenica]QIS18271.1 hypothetical protein F6W96_08245 [Nocardia terpenica]
MCPHSTYDRADKLIRSFLIVFVDRHAIGTKRSADKTVDHVFEPITTYRQKVTDAGFDMPMVHDWTKPVIATIAAIGVAITGMGTHRLARMLLRLHRPSSAQITPPQWQQLHAIVAAHKDVADVARYIALVCDKPR